ncbi:uncharacterized protein L3040_006046 [Drepanopeziza brunnea f. sp. 'multigermtubi']|uniref:uncharacterized protein n=1 Tax=Drepanopeziza brunnea f. sp. 'multigermtubi' TaxID=698441 RepID=UPI00239FE0DF|nr:hypothetical protein L3040_006046 [Drepanopeziza brunnea f. sp. 'multigermtubi']
MLDIHAWQCCKCNSVDNPITDDNVAWLTRLRVPVHSMSSAQESSERCTNQGASRDSLGALQPCNHRRCSLCWDLDATGQRLRRCDGGDDDRDGAAGDDDDDGDFPVEDDADAGERYRDDIREAEFWAAQIEEGEGEAALLRDEALERFEDDIREAEFWAAQIEEREGEAAPLRDEALERSDDTALEAEARV